MTITLKKPKPVANSLKLLKGEAVEPPSLSEIEKIAKRIKARNSTHAIETGRDLLKAKSLLPHGEFGPWLKANFEWTAKTAQNYMNAAKLAEKSETVSFLKPAAVVALAAPSVPEAVKSEVIADIAAGKKPTVKQVKAKIAAAKPAKVKPSMSSKDAPDLGDLVSRLQAAGLELAIVAMEVAFPGTDLELRLVNLEAA